MNVPAGLCSGQTVAMKHLLGNRASIKKYCRGTLQPFVSAALNLQDCQVRIRLGAAMFYQTRCPIV